jgi:hypothetical protein
MHDATVAYPALLRPDAEVAQVELPAVGYAALLARALTPSCLVLKLQKCFCAAC